MVSPSFIKYQLNINMKEAKNLYRKLGNIILEIVKNRYDSPGVKM